MPELPPLSRLTPPRFYRMPWTIAVNGFSWLEPTPRCNLGCEYRARNSQSVKDLRRIAREVERLPRLRRCDVVIVAGASRSPTPTSPSTYDSSEHAG